MDKDLNDKLVELYDKSVAEIQDRVRGCLSAAVGSDTDIQVGVYCLINAVLNIAGTAKEAGFESDCNNIGNYLIECGTIIKNWDHTKITAPDAEKLS